jgi:hypothetical protein
MSGNDVDEFPLLRENAAEAACRGPGLRRDTVSTPNGQVSCLIWDDGPPELALLHGGAQNAHTWDTVALALSRP